MKWSKTGPLSMALSLVPGVVGGENTGHSVKSVANDALGNAHCLLLRVDDDLLLFHTRAFPINDLGQITAQSC